MASRGRLRAPKKVPCDAARAVACSAIPRRRRRTPSGGRASAARRRGSTRPSRAAPAIQIEQSAVSCAAPQSWQSRSLPRKGRGVQQGAPCQPRPRGWCQNRKLRRGGGGSSAKIADCSNRAAARPERRTPPRSKDLERLAVAPPRKECVARVHEAVVDATRQPSAQSAMTTRAASSSEGQTPEAPTGRRGSPPGKREAERPHVVLRPLHCRHGQDGEEGARDQKGAKDVHDTSPRFKALPQSTRFRRRTADAFHYSHEFDEKRSGGLMFLFVSGGVRSQEKAKWAGAPRWRLSRRTPRAGDGPRGDEDMRRRDGRHRRDSGEARFRSNGSGADGRPLIHPQRA